MISRCDASADCVLPGHVTYLAECFATGCWDRAHALGMRMSTVVRPELQLSRAVRSPSAPESATTFSAVSVLAAEWRIMPMAFLAAARSTPTRGRDIRSVCHLPPSSAPPAPHYQFVHLPYDRLRKQRCRSTKVTMRCICASEGIQTEPVGTA